LSALDSGVTWLGDDGWIIVQMHPKEYVEIELANLEEFDQRRYGTTLLAFYRRPAS
jgi:16S rRNA (guanine966-N2)-methyltransferase